MELGAPMWVYDHTMELGTPGCVHMIWNSEASMWVHVHGTIIGGFEVGE